ncbi:methylthioribulose 1-phosphate dehydratase [Spongiibacter sp. KMU-158]|uniref:Methylthioribulose-1-phosphate dehydratase n=1 Tax=Spongiibacter pelagi TaxID=2760804 RepID=A0A927C1K1_9GAMM|nr:methylthioribulose 1-phosphate dehydratase [Spongiibacter pelagi]MBD2858111.1 methylthioribulose 1-phosphate dehydratase [Spongiibacter pelagi]
MKQTKQFFDLAIALAAIGEDLHRRGWVPATSGNFSQRLDEHSAIVTASGRHKGRLAPTDFLAVDLNGQPLSDGKPSAETLLHTQLYARFADIGAVLHCHSPSVTVLSRQISGNTLRLEGYELLKAFNGIDTHDTFVDIPIFENTQDIAALADEVDTYFNSHPNTPAYLIRGHGVYCWGEDLDSCMRNLEALDFLLQCDLQERMLTRK